MSADAWRICPKCEKINSEGDREKAISAAKFLYGKVPQADWVRLMAQAEKVVDDPKETLREDYEIYMDESGFLNIHYRCGCDVCGFSHKYEVRKNTMV